MNYWKREDRESEGWTDRREEGEEGDKREEKREEENWEVSGRGGREGGIKPGVLCR